MHLLYRIFPPKTRRELLNFFKVSPPFGTKALCPPINPSRILSCFCSFSRKSAQVIFAVRKVCYNKYKSIPPIVPAFFYLYGAGNHTIRGEQDNMTASKDAVSARQLKILKMDTLHLNHYLNEMMLENPVIEIEENLTGYTDEDMRARKAEWLESNDFEEGLGYFDKETELPEAEDPDYALLNMHEGKTLEQHLRSQISVQQLDERVRAAANYLAGCLDENGYLLAQAQDLAEAGFCESEFDEALAVIRNLEPLGVGASSLKECLCLQLDEGDEIARRLLDEIDLTGSIDPAELAARFGVPAQEIEQAMLRIRRLNPKPGSQYTSHSRSPYILPDVTMIKFVDEYYVALNDYSLPRIRINEEYQNMLLRARGEEHREEREYLEEKIADAKLLQEQIAFRGRTLLEVTKALIKLQEPFFRYGPRYTKLLPIQELAQALSMPEELVSATLKNKYLQSPFGVYPMKYFLAREHHPQQEGIEAIRQQLAQLIRGEHPDEPYTDEQLAQLMAKDGVFMTEELVERLREELNIPDSEHRIFYDPQSEEEHCCDDDCGHHHH